MKHNFLSCLTISVVFYFSLLPSLLGYQLVTILGVSNTEKTIFVRLGYPDGVDEGMEATFTSDNISIIARAHKVTNEFSVWKIIEPNGKIPFMKNQVVTFNYAVERIWMFDPDNYLSFLTNARKERLKALEAMGKLRTRTNYPHWLSGRYYRGEGLNQTVAVSTSKNISTREQNISEIIYGYTFNPISIQLHLGYRFEQQISYATNIEVSAKRNLFTGGINYYYQPTALSPTFYHYIGVSFGYGQISTKVGPESLKGESYLLPVIQTGLEYIFPFGLGLGAEVALESIYNQETLGDGYRQDSSETNLRAGLVLGYLF